ncbi:MAG: BNR-4 repeat-containing protein [Phycisphaerae bacterium]|nr:BNR-4 repeat-containing protein [Phycisphaerae bacterium]
MQRSAVFVVVLLLAGRSPCPASAPRPIASNALGGTLARDHQSRAMYFEGKHRRTYLTYLDNDFDARITYYDHDAKTWSEPVRVDNCVAEVGWCKGLKDGHNAPNLWVSKSGTIHLIYGSHGTPFKYARSVEPERIDRWELGKRLSNFATYPFFSQLPDGEMLMFYRYGPTGGYKKPFLGLQRTADEGRTWSEVKKLAALGKACKLNGSNALYDPGTGRIFLNLALIPEKSWMSFACQYDPSADRMYAWDGKTCLGPMPNDAPFVEHCPVEGKPLQEIFLRDGVLYMLLGKTGGALSFARWDGKALAKHDIPAAKTTGIMGGPIWTADGKRIRFYANRKDTRRKPPPRGGDVCVWTSEDGGKTWDDGRSIVKQKDLGIELQGLNRVMNYPGNGPFLIIAEATGQYPKDFKITPTNHYDNPWRKNRKLYALDEQGRFLNGPGE